MSRLRGGGVAMGRTWRQGKGDSMVQGSVRNTGIPPLLKRGLLSYSACSKPPSSQSSLHLSCPFLPVSTPSTSVVPSSQSSLYFSRPFLPVSPPSTSVFHSSLSTLHLSRRTIACCKGPQNSEAHNQWPFLNPFFTVS